MIPPQELKNKVFTSAFRGYEPAEVDEYVDFLVDKYTEVFAQCDEYFKKLKLVANKISEMQSEEEAIHKLSIETQKHCDKRVKDAEEAASQILQNAENKAKEILHAAEEKEGIILNSAKQIAQSSLSAVSQKAEEQIESTNAKSEALLLSTKTRCAKILAEFKKEIGIQRENLEKIKSVSDDFNTQLFNTYKEHLNTLTNSMPSSEFSIEEYTESKLLDTVLTEIKNDAASIAEKIDIKDYDFAKELEALRNSSDSIERLVTASKSKEHVVADTSDIKIKSNDEETNNESELEKTTVFSKVPEKMVDGDDVKVFAGKTANKYGVEFDNSEPTAVFNTTKSQNSTDNSYSHRTSMPYNEIDDEEDEDEERNEEDNEESVSVYGSGNYNPDQHNTNINNSIYGNAGGDMSYSNKTGYDGNISGSNDSPDNDDDIDEDVDIDDEEAVEIERKGIFNIFNRKKNNKKSKPKVHSNAGKDEDYYGFERGKKDKDNDDVMNIFEDLDE